MGALDLTPDSDSAERSRGLHRWHLGYSRNENRQFEHHLRVCPVCGWWVHFKES